ncbi:MAG: hypothetical protein H0S82_00150, partial [Anaerolineaceae bacterium]|nr:hypothetical protein [Anaerolineaceae bacterium]
EATSLMRWKYAKQTLTTEILRGRRYHNDVSVVLFDYDQRNQLSQEDIDRFNKVLAEVLLDGIRTNLDIAFINDHLGLILPETGDKGALILTQRLVQKVNRLVDVRVVAGIASFPQDAITEDEIVLQAKAAMQVALETDLLVTTYHGINPEDLEAGYLPDTSIAEPAEDQREHQEYVNILESIALDKNQWVVWIEGFDTMNDLSVIEEQFNEIAHIQGIDFLFVQENHLVIKISSRLEDLINTPDAFPGWVIVKTSPENHYLLIRKEADKAE